MINLTNLTKGVTMTKVAPIHSKKPSAPQVYHDDDQCTERNNIEKENIVPGTGGRPKCDHCKRLSG
jgi:hypothetical protein